jgi:hypothetical protein
MGLGACSPYVPLTRAERHALRDPLDPDPISVGLFCLERVVVRVENFGSAETESRADPFGDDGFDLARLSVPGHAF